MSRTTFLLHRRRGAVAALATGAVALFGASSASAQLPPTLPVGPTPGTHAGPFGGFGLFKGIIDVFGAVRTAVPGIAAPIIAQGVTDGTITQVQADELTALFTVHHGLMGGMGHTPLAPEQRTVLHSVMQAVLTQLPAIAQPVLDADVASGDLTQAQADMIAHVIALISSFHPGSLGLGTHGAGATANPVTVLQHTVTKRVKKAARHHKKHNRHTSRTQH
jgi:hypothetical protein